MDRDRFVEVTGPQFRVTCMHCGEVATAGAASSDRERAMWDSRGIVILADTKGESFKAYYHAKCVENVAEGRR